ncbi:MAG: sulfatase-like hydrolase/transferase [Pirellulales bacterium]
MLPTQNPKTAHLIQYTVPGDQGYSSSDFGDPSKFTEAEIIERVDLAEASGAELTSLAFTPIPWSASAVARSPRPNVVFILADDLGYGDVNCFGGDRCQIDTPGFDQLAREGMRFTGMYANASHCIPTRVAIMTGRYPWCFSVHSPGSGTWGTWGNTPPREDAWREAVKTYGHHPKSHAELSQTPFVQLFHLQDDPSEANNLAAQHPEKVRELLSLLEHQIEQGRSTAGPKFPDDLMALRLTTKYRSLCGATGQLPNAELAC